MRLLAALLLAVPLSAHVGSPDVFFEGQAGPYRLLVTIRPPEVIPGVAQIEIRTTSPDVREVRIVPLRVTGPGATLAPVPDEAQRSKDDLQFYTGSLWLMNTGAWQVRVQVDGPSGPGTLSVPVPAASTRVLAMQTSLRVTLVILLLVLFFGIVSIIGAGTREAQLEPGVEPDAPTRTRSRIVMSATAVALLAVLWLGNQWWKSEAGEYQQKLFKSLELRAKLAGANQLALELHDPGWLNRRLDDLVPDHNHLMHLYLIRVPELDQVWHLHPERTGDGTFLQALPSLGPGRYAVYGDIVHETGFSETATGQIELPAVAGQPLTGDDAGSNGPPLAKADYNSGVASLSDGYRMIFDRASAPYHARRPYELHFRIEDPAGNAAQGMELYMGMQAHAAVVATDGSVFAHLHPSGSVSMAALQLIGDKNMASEHMMMHHQALPPDFSIPYGFPKPGAYRIFVQSKRADTVETGFFDIRVEN
jgi:hypothetical protein